VPPRSSSIRAAADFVSQAVAEIIEQSVNVFEMDQVPLRVLPLRRARGTGVADRSRFRDLLSADRNFALGKLEVLGIAAQLVQLGNEQRRCGMSLLYRERGVFQNTQVVVDIGPGDIPMHGALPPTRNS
jgi:hypothetical protein